MFLRLYVQEAVPSTHCYITYFFDKLLERDEGYNFQEVRDWSRRIEGGIFALEDLVVPINVNNRHWLFLPVDIASKKIELYDSNNREYLTKMRC